PDIGDGRAILLGEVRNNKGEIWDLHLKGAGRTKYSRVFDGRAVLRSCIREYLCSEAMHGLDIPTTRALCIIGSDEKVERETTEKGAMMIRMAQTHVRFGSFEAFHYSDRPDCVKLLADYVIEHHFPDFIAESDKYSLFFNEVASRTAKLIAQWQSVGFTHGVMNTDNMSITGLTIDYGPYGFIEEYNPDYTPNHSDNFGRYSYQSQPGIALWNLNKLAVALSSIINGEQAQDSLDNFRNIYSIEYVGIISKKLGFKEQLTEDVELIKRLLAILANEKVDYTIFFRRLSNITSNNSGYDREIVSTFEDQEPISNWISSYKLRLKAEDRDDSERKRAMDLVNAKFILRNYLAENAIRKAVDEADYSEIERLHKILTNPFSEQIQFQDYAEASPDWGKNLVISCSS
ncbi:MAG: YdiU family protein, partial [Thermodesulfobacteriota bacterium]